MANEKGTINVYSTKKTLEVLDICRTTLYDKYINRLSKLPRQGNRNYFLEKEVLALKEEISTKRNKMQTLGFNVVG